MSGNFYVNCAAKRKNTGIGNRCQDLGPIAGFMITPYGWSDTEENVRLKSTFDTAIQADDDERIYPFPPILNMTNNSEETVYQELALGRLFVKNGKTILQFALKSSRYKHEAMKSHSLQQCGVILFDQQNRLQGIKEDGLFKTINLQEFVVEKLQLNDGASVSTHSLISLVFEDPESFETSPAVVSGLEWSANSLEGLIDVNIDVVADTPALTGLSITCAVDKMGDAFNPVGPTTEPVTLGDIVIKNAAGVTQTITSVTSENGTAVIVATLIAGTYTVNFYDPADMVTQGYESTGSASFTVS
jgi:hypothetical protein